MPRNLVAGIDSSTQQAKLMIVDAATGELHRSSALPHPAGTEISPLHWWDAFEGVGGTRVPGASAISITAQQHSTIFLDSDGQPLRDAILWNDLRATGAARQLRAETGDARWLDAVCLLPDSAHPISRLRWLREHEPAAARALSAVLLPHDWLTWRLLGATGSATTDRSDASATGYWSQAAGRYEHDLIERSLGHGIELPRVIAPDGVAGESDSGLLVGAGCGDNAATHLGLDTQDGDMVISIGTSTTVSMRTAFPVRDPTGYVDTMADARGGCMPIVAMLNGARIIDATARMLGASVTGIDVLAGSAAADADGVLLLPFLDGERNPPVSHGGGVFAGLARSSATPATVARAALLGLACAIANAVDAIVDLAGDPRQMLVVGGGARSAELRTAIAELVQRPVHWPEHREHAAYGAARQAAWALSGSLPQWPLSPMLQAAPSEGLSWVADVRGRYDELVGAVAGL